MNLVSKHLNMFHRIDLLRHHNHQMELDIMNLNGIDILKMDGVLNLKNLLIDIKDLLKHYKMK